MVLISSNSRPKRNIQKFIRETKTEFSIFKVNIDWSHWQWIGIGMFSKLGTGKRIADPKGKLFAPEFIDFAKAYVASHWITTNSQEGSSQLLGVLRVVERALIVQTGKANPIDIDLLVLNHADQILRETYSVDGAYTTCRKLVSFAKFIGRRGLTVNDTTSWKSSLPTPRRTHAKFGKEGQSYRKKKLPDLDAICALGQIFSSGFDLEAPGNSRDIFVTSISAMLLGAPSRISEILALSDDCELEEQDENGVLHYGWRFKSVKNKKQSWRIKWIPDDWAPVAKEAIRRLKVLSEDARKFAAYAEKQLRLLEKGKTDKLKFYRAPGFPNVADDVPLSSGEIEQIFGVAEKAMLLRWGLSTRHGCYTLNDLWGLVLKGLPAGFPYVANVHNTHLRFDNALFCFWPGQLHGKARKYSLHVATPNQFQVGLVGNGASKGIFERRNLFDAAGRPLRALSHQFRHLLNTFAKEGTGETYLSNEAINFWSGREKKWQGQYYDHEPIEDKVRKATDALRRPDGSLKVIDIPVVTSDLDSNVPATQYWNISEILPRVTADVEIAHRSPVLWTYYGGCEHDWMLEPCQHHKNCLNCTEFFCIKGAGLDAQERLVRLKALLPLLIEQEEKAKEACDIGCPGAHDWHKYQALYRARVAELITILESENVPEGAIIKISGATAISHLHRVLRETSLKALRDNLNERELVESLVQTYDQESGS
ncbi:hypothetical protein [Herbaspirillum robiniae]|uniref:hypothetical protein n=1 Tax=Herbaspirillum robiniae TaxID=2014887 RepID=UPI0011E4CE1F|nr:hypothetical protein [Herbaspirillum robiniae]